MHTLFQVWRVACFECFTAMRSRRAWVILALYLAASLFTMNTTISVMSKLETKLTQVLQLPVSEKTTTGIVSKKLWDSKPFQDTVKMVSKDSLVYQDVKGKHPIELIYAWLCFFYAPLLVILVSANRIPNDLYSGAVKYMMFRVSRGAWSVGKLLGQSLMIAAALLLSAIGAYLVAVIRLKSGIFDLFLPLFGWSIRAWFLSFAYLGAVMGISHATRSGSKATVMGVIVIFLFSIISFLCKFYAERNGFCAHLLMLLPNGHQTVLWRSSFRPLLYGSSFLLALGASYFALGYLFFRKRDL